MSSRNKFYTTIWRHSDMTIDLSANFEDSNSEEWIVTSLLDICSEGPAYGANASSEEFKPEWPRYIRITDIDSYGNLSTSGKKSLHPNIAENYMLELNDILIARSGATVGKSYIHQSGDFSACFAGYMIRFRINMEIAVPMYVFFVLQSTLFTRFIEEQNRGGSQPNISASQYGTFSFPLPPIDIQEAIVEIITQSYDNLSNINQLIGKLEMMREGLLTDLLTYGVDDNGKLNYERDLLSTPFGQIPSDWQIQIAEQYCHSIADGTHDSPRQIDSGRPLITSKNLGMDGKIDWEKISYISEEDYNQVRNRSWANHGDILFGMIGTLGNPVIIGVENKK